MNSGKYLYKLPSEEKKVPIPKKVIKVLNYYECQ